MNSIAITVWNSIISPVFDSSKVFLFVWPDDRREFVTFQDLSLWAIFDALKKNDAKTLICGAISRPAAVWLTENRITVVPWIRGHVDSVIEAYKEGNLQSGGFLMPGCGYICRGRLRRRQRVGRKHL